MSRTPPAAPTAAALLLYWLLVVCGLAGLTLQRIETPQELVPLWVGTVGGVALGQLLAWSRVRVWLIAAISMGALWISPVLYFVLYSWLGAGVETCLLALLPAAACGYLSLSERGGLIAFWYPAVLWMLVILDGPGAGAFDARAALPLVVGLAALFIAFLRARETRRVALWQGHASARLAAPLPRTVLRTSPLRAASAHAWTGLVGAATLVLAAWVAPHLWQTESGKHAAAAAAAAAARSTTTASSDVAGAPPCCAATSAEPEQRERVREYFPLLHGHDAEPKRPIPTQCVTCSDGTASASYHGGADYGVGGAGSEVGDPTSTVASGTTPSTVSPSTPTPAYAADPPPVSPWAPATPPASPLPAPVSPQPKHAALTPAAPTPAPAPPVDSGAPWRSTLALCLGGLALHALVRTLRRQLTLRHLARPFWPETVDQRISNHWERMLVGLRDAGIHAASSEQPAALARRVGIAGMDTCATILERVRHGVRVDATDLDAMDAAASAVYRTARQNAGFTARAAASLRWPLA